MKDLRQYDVVVMNHNEDATLWRVREIDGVRVLVVDAEAEAKIPNIRPHWVDRASLKRPSYAQLARLA